MTRSSFLPDVLPQLPGWEIAARLRAARQVGGGFYDVFQFDVGGQIGLVIGDVCDKGVGAALVLAPNQNPQGRLRSMSLSPLEEHEPCRMKVTPGFSLAKGRPRSSTDSDVGPHDPREGLALGPWRDLRMVARPRSSLPSEGLPRHPRIFPSPSANCQHQRRSIFA